MLHEDTRLLLGDVVAVLFCSLLVYRLTGNPLLAFVVAAYLVWKFKD